MRTGLLFVIGWGCLLATTATELLQNTTEISSPPTTEAPTTLKPKVDVINSDLCKKCKCDRDYKKLDCSNKNLTTWFSDAEWSILQNGDLIFETVIMEANNLAEIPQLPRYPVKNLYVGFNQITNIALGAFGNLTELTKLDLSHNKLSAKVMVPDVFKGRYSPSAYLPLENMIELDLCHNDLHSLDPDLFEHLPKLESLILCKNIFQVIDHLTETAIAGLRFLKTLDLSYMELKDLPDNLLHGPRDLENLILSGNLLNQIPNSLERATNLKRLVLDENLMTDFDNKSFPSSLKSLQYLSISSLPDLERISKGGLSNLQNLTELVASNNPKLSYIDASAFTSATSNPEIFNYPPLEKLYLHNNNLTTLDSELVKRWDKINVIDLRFNPWHCNCENSWLIRTLMTQINSTNPILARNVECSSPVNWRNVPLMDINAQKTLVCSNDSPPVHDGLILVSLLIGLLVGIPLTLGALVLYRRGCFGLLNRSSASNRALYNRASFSDDFHI